MQASTDFCATMQWALSISQITSGHSKGEVHEQEFCRNPLDVVSDHSCDFFRRVVFTDRGGSFGANRPTAAACLRAAHLPRAGILLDAGILGLER